MTTKDETQCWTGVDECVCMQEGDREQAGWRESDRDWMDGYYWGGSPLETTH